jgi:hypothetical protein
MVEQIPALANLDLRVSEFVGMTVRQARISRHAPLPSGAIRIDRPCDGVPDPALVGVMGGGFGFRIRRGCRRRIGGRWGIGVCDRLRLLDTYQRPACKSQHHRNE